MPVSEVGTPQPLPPSTTDAEPAADVATLAARLGAAECEVSVLRAEVEARSSRERAELEELRAALAASRAHAAALESREAERAKAALWAEADSNRRHADVAEAAINKAVEAVTLLGSTL